MRFFGSIRWRLLLWNGMLLALVLTGFGVTAWRLERATSLLRVDQDLERRVAGIAERTGRRPGGPGRPREMRPERREPPPPRPGEPPPRRSDDVPPPPPEGPRPEPEDPLEGVQGFYYVAWNPDGREIARSASAPADVPRPEGVAGSRGSRLRGNVREYFHFTPPGGDCILVGREISGELAEMRRFAWLLTGAGGTVFVLGLAGGWWISTRALQPIASISATALRISTGDLAQRIPIADAGSELDDLARVLNDTFTRLQASFVRQAQFSADASHELRTPVSVVLTQTQSALARERSAAEYRESLAACQNAAQRMRGLIESLLTLARLDSGQATRPAAACALDRVASEAVELQRPLAEQRGVTLATDLAPAACLGNAEQLGQVVANLVGNAIHYNRPGGRVSVGVRTEAGAAVLSVADTGQGIAAGDLPHVFQRFYRADKSRSNAAGRTGLGLAITRAIVDAHAGSIEVASQPGQGSTFTVRLPACPAPPTSS